MNPDEGVQNSLLSEPNAIVSNRNIQNNHNEVPNMVLSGPVTRSKSNQSNKSQCLVSDTVPVRGMLREPNETKFEDDPVSSVRPIPARIRHDISTKNWKGG